MKVKFVKTVPYGRYATQERFDIIVMVLNGNLKRKGKELAYPNHITLGNPVGLKYEISGYRLSKHKALHVRKLGFVPRCLVCIKFDRCRLVVVDVFDRCRFVVAGSLRHPLSGRGVFLAIVQPIGESRSVCQAYADVLSVMIRRPRPT